MKALLAPFFLLGLLAGCAIGPDYRLPAAIGTNRMPAAFAGAAALTNMGNWKPAEPSAHLPRGVWWEIFGDSELNRLETAASEANQDLAVAFSRFEQARALVNVARADLFPQASATPSLTRQRTSVNMVDRGQASGVSHTYSTFTVPLDASWELDLWGRVRRQVEAARAFLSAASDDLEAAKLAVQAEVAADYFVLRAMDAEYTLLQQTAEAYRRSLELTRNRRQGGIASDLDVAQAETQLTTTEAQLPAVDLQRAKLRHALGTLCGQVAGGFEPAPAQGALTSGPAIPISLPSELLERRPDIAAVERRMAAANAQVGVAQTAFYPRLLFRGAAGFQAIDASTLFDWPSRFLPSGRRSNCRCSPAAAIAPNSRPPAPLTTAPSAVTARRCWSLFRKSKINWLPSACSRLSLTPRTPRSPPRGAPWKSRTTAIKPASSPTSRSPRRRVRPWLTSGRLWSWGRKGGPRVWRSSRRWAAVGVRKKATGP